MMIVNGPLFLPNSYSASPNKSPLCCWGAPERDNRATTTTFGAIAMERAGIIASLSVSVTFNGRLDELCRCTASGGPPALGSRARMNSGIVPDTCSRSCGAKDTETWIDREPAADGAAWDVGAEA